MRQGDVEAFDVDGLERIGGSDVRGDLGDLAVANGDVHHRVDVVLVVDDVTVGEDKVVCDVCRRRRRCSRALRISDDRDRYERERSRARGEVACY